MPVKTSLFNHPVLALPFKGSIDGHDQHHNIDDHSLSIGDGFLEWVYILDNRNFGRNFT
jgi:hypothetical protein